MTLDGAWAAAIPLALGRAESRAPTLGALSWVRVASATAGACRKSRWRPAGRRDRARSRGCRRHMCSRAFRRSHAPRPALRWCRGRASRMERSRARRSSSPISRAAMPRPRCDGSTITLPHFSAVTAVGARLERQLTAADDAAVGLVASDEDEARGGRAAAVRAPPSRQPPRHRAVAREIRLRRRRARRPAASGSGRPAPHARAAAASASIRMPDARGCMARF